MTEPTSYEIVLRGRATDRLLRPLLDDFVVDHPGTDRTRLIGDVRDPAHLHGVLAHLTSLAAEVISLRPAEPDRPPAARASNHPSNERQDQ